MAVYNPTVDYFSQLLEFARLHPKFNPDHNGDRDYAVRLSLINDCLHKNEEIDYTCDQYNHFWFKWVVSDISHANKINEGLKLLIKSVSIGDPLQDNWIFLTLNFNDTEPINALKMLEFAQLICKKDWVQRASFVLEKHRINGIHHHIHMLIDLNIHQRKSKTIELVYKIAGLKKYVAGKQYIDVKCEKDVSRAPREVYENYVSGSKKEEKMFFVIKDQAWRKFFGVQDMYNYIKP